MSGGDELGLLIAIGLPCHRCMIRVERAKGRPTCSAPKLELPRGSTSDGAASLRGGLLVRRHVTGALQACL